ncbi:MAG: hypothetical protein ACKVQC_06890 [Elusimicrobiota bacterium]
MKKLLAIFISLQLILPPLSHAAFDDLGVGGRAPGMADSFVAVADDVNALYYNPAGLVQVLESQLSAQYGQLLRGLDDGSSLGTSYIGYAHPFRRGRLGTLGLGYHNFKAANLFNERTLFLSYAMRLNMQPFGWKGVWSAGATLKQLHREFQPDRFATNALNDGGNSSSTADPIFASGFTKDAYSLDVGGLYQFGKDLNTSIGGALINLNQPDISFGGDGDKAPLMLKGGVAHRPEWGLLSIEMRRINRLENSADNEIALGLERNIKLTKLGALTMRGGYESGSRSLKNFSAGVSYTLNRTQFDYAFDFPLSGGGSNTGNHRVGLSMKMGSSLNNNIVSIQDEQIALLAAFRKDSLTTLLGLERLDQDLHLSSEQKDRSLLILLRRYPLDDDGLKEAKPRLLEALKNNPVDSSDWAELKHNFFKSLPEEDRANAHQSVELYIKGQSQSAMARLALMSPASKKNYPFKILTMMSLGELAAQAYRKEEIDSTIDKVRQMMEMVPDDPVIESAYRELLNRQTMQKMARAERRAEDAAPELPSAPSALVGMPNPFSNQSTTIQNASAQEKDFITKNFANALGYYLVKKSNGASNNEKRVLLEQMKAVYGVSGMDMSLIDKELTSLGETTKEVTPEAVVITPAPEVKPETIQVSKPQPIVQPEVVSPPAEKVTAEVEQPQESVKTTPTKPVESQSNFVTSLKEAIESRDIDLDSAIEYYRAASERDLTDRERLEVLETIMKRFGEKGAQRVQSEIERIRKRLRR